MERKRQPCPATKVAGNNYKIALRRLLSPRESACADFVAFARDYERSELSPGIVPQE